MKVFAPQRFLTFNKASVEDACAALACLAARFSLRDLPDVLVIVCRGDLSDIANPLIWGDWMVPTPLILRLRSRPSEIPDRQDVFVEAAGRVVNPGGHPERVDDRGMAPAVGDFARLSRSASDWRAIARFMLSGS